MAQEPTQMTLSDLTSKTPEELNVMCAELCGWKLSERKTFQGNPIYERDGVFAARVCAPRDDVRWLPNYTGSWDAIMPVRDGLTDAQWEAYLKHLAQILDSQREPSDVTPMRLVRDLMRAERHLHVIALILTLTK